jgi:hypothetical protein
MQKKIVCFIPAAGRKTKKSMDITHSNYVYGAFVFCLFQLKFVKTQRTLQLHFTYFTIVIVNVQ